MESEPEIPEARAHIATHWTFGFVTGLEKKPDRAGGECDTAFRYFKSMPAFDLRLLSGGTRRRRHLHCKPELSKFSPPPQPLFVARVKITFKILGQSISQRVSKMGVPYSKEIEELSRQAKDVGQKAAIGIWVFVLLQLLIIVLLGLILWVMWTIKEVVVNLAVERKPAIPRCRSENTGEQCL
jgi:hypothetical protein